MLSLNLLPLDSTPDMWTAIQSIFSDIYTNIINVLAIVVAVALIVAIIFMIATNDEKKAAAGKSWAIRIVVGFIIILCVGSIIAYLISVTQKYHFDTSTKAMVTTQFSFLASHLNFLGK
jgi:heme/copper-type cytochrome/quinol oxidase subunit 2